MSVLWGRETKALCVAYEALVYGSIETQVCPNEAQQNIKALHLVNAGMLFMNYFFSLRFWASTLMEKLLLRLSLVSRGVLFVSMYSYLSGVTYCRPKD